VFLLLDEVGCGKTKQIVDASQILFHAKLLDTVIVVAPGSARSTWAHEDPLLGEVSKHAWASQPNIIHEYHKHYTDLDLSAQGLHWIVTNYEFIRREERLQGLIRLTRPRLSWLIADESWMINGWSQQMRAVRRLRNKRADRVCVLNGTPLSDGEPEDLYYVCDMLDERILDCPNKATFRAKYCIMQQGVDYPKVIGHQHLDDFNQRIAPYVLSRKTRDCWDLPPMLDPITIEARLSNENWDRYTSMRDDMVTWLGTQASVSRQAIVKILRLSQITSGFLGGLEDLDADDGSGWDEDPEQPKMPSGPMPQWLKSLHNVGTEEAPVEAPVIDPSLNAPIKVAGPKVREIGREKLDAFLHWLDTMRKRPNKLLVWSRFTPELLRTTTALGAYYPEVLNLKGKQRPAEREAAKLLLAPGADPNRKGAVVGNQRAGSASLNFAAAPIAVYLSNGPRLLERTQSIGRIERPGALEPMLIVDVMATGPKGQKTIDHHQISRLRAKDDMAKWTVQQWRDLLKKV
jgi:hypothetical protein